MTVNMIIKKAIERLKKEGKLLTPDSYAEAFCIEAKKAGILVEDCQQVDKFTRNLDKKFQSEIHQYRIKTTQELIRFLISKINRLQPTKCAETLDAQLQLSKRILQVVSVLHNKEASELSYKTIDLLDNNASAEQLDQIRQLWMNFLALYDDTYLQKLSKYGDLDISDLRATIESLECSGHKVQSSAKGDWESIAALVIAALVPSIASSVNENIANVSETLRQHPELLDSKSMSAEIKEAIKLRIALDKASLKEMVSSLDDVLDKLSRQLIELIERSDNSTIEIQDIKRELEAFERSNQSDFKTAHNKLYTIAVTLEEKTSLLSRDLQDHNKKIGTLSKKVAQLEKELVAAKQASREDFLTKLANKRALEEQMQIKEGEYERYGRDFSIVMFDLDLFKQVNDTYGHDAGDAVLSGFGQILKKLHRNVDVVGRYGGEEFMALLSNTDLAGGIKFAQKVNKTVEKTKFMYKGKRIHVTVSCGVSHRKQYQSLKATVNAADQFLYDAKSKGRNRVEPQL